MIEKFGVISKLSASPSSRWWRTVLQPSSNVVIFAEPCSATSFSFMLALFPIFLDAVLDLMICSLTVILNLSLDHFQQVELIDLGNFE